MMRAINTTKKTEIARNVMVANSLLKRMKGLLGRTTMQAGEALLITPCRGIHTFGMRFPIDAVFLDRINQVIAIKENLSPNHITGIYFKATSVLELPSGTVETTITGVGDEVEIA